MEGNLKSYHKGQSGNPKGRPKGTVSIKAQLAKVLDSMAPATALKLFQDELKGKNKAKNKDLVALAMVRAALGGEVPAMKMLLEQFDGKPVQPVDMNAKISANEEALEVIRAIGRAKGIKLPE